MSSNHINKNVLSGGRQEEQIPSCICADEEREDIPVQTPCCKQFIHESCLAAAFNAFPFRRPICPFCRAILYPLNGDEPSPHHAIGIILRFRHVTFLPVPGQQRPPTPPPGVFFHNEEDGSDYESDENEMDGFHFNPPLVPYQPPDPSPPRYPTPVPPPGWREFMAHHYPPRSTFSSGRPG